ncbi:vicilin-like seed storage protein At2g28490 [Solanum lycopersicum]|uniref:Cupin type-1 domain-containing protein n=1 Tax=Solanum lycopersicum TaxID=4081 RepID=A0A3Q7H0U9_SOLLC|nr:vicilin-like seed storage protein At2g28490 [Solanum lycopersicum]
MEDRRTLLLLVLVLFSALVSSVSANEEEEIEQRTQGEKWFVLRQLHNVVQTDAGSMRMVKGGYRRDSFLHSPMHIGFISMEPTSLFIPQYLDSNLILFVHHGEARVGHIHSGELVERHLKHGDVYTIPAGSAFYLENRLENQRLRIICSIDITSESMGWHAFQSFFIGGGTHTVSVLAGFDHNTLATALNVSPEELQTFLTRQTSGPIVHISGSHHKNMWSEFLAQEPHQKLAHLKRIVNFGEEASPKEEKSTWSLRKFLLNLVNRKNVINHHHHKAPSVYNLYKKKPNFKNHHGWSKNVDSSDYSPLEQSGNGVYLVNLSPGSMMAPHVNPSAIEYGVVLKGTGRIQIVYPNGTLAMNARVQEGDVFWVPRYFPFCQIASTNGHFEFFGFTTSARRNHQQFLVGKNSLMQSLRGPEFAAAFGIDEKRLKRIANAQHEQVILPASWWDSSQDKASEPERKKRTNFERIVGSLGSDMIMGFD